MPTRLIWAYQVPSGTRPSGDTARIDTRVPSTLGVRPREECWAEGWKSPGCKILKCYGQGEMPNRQATIFYFQVLIFISSAHKIHKLFFFPHAAATASSKSLSAEPLPVTACHLAFIKGKPLCVYLEHPRPNVSDTVGYFGWLLCTVASC